MAILHARVKGGRILIDEPTDLPDGTELSLLQLDADHDLAMTTEERAHLETSLELVRADIAASEDIPVVDLFARRSIRARLRSN